MCRDGLKGFPQAVEAVFPQTIVQTCIVHLIRISTRFVAWINRKALIANLKRVYRAETEEAALAALAEFEKRWGERYPMVAQAWRANWERVRPFFAFGAEIRGITLIVPLYASLISPFALELPIILWLLIWGAKSQPTAAPGFSTKGQARAAG